ncbi:fasciclin domain-containing protein [Ilumatobacter nonamiensis]|uniref:fasciclin domain-containing protein n=1 Tax=Ilumatobacter nonamiensis TaxID=467093 RepID=UPI0003457ACE|nr:fasciclin domain-containing protein [Ilumatobacter nonamiensis]
MSATTPVSFRRYRRRVLTIGAAAFLVVFALGAVITIPRIQSDLENRVEAALAANGIDGVTASFSGQDGTLGCSEPIAELDRAVEVSNDVRGVRAIDVATTCSAGDDAEAVSEADASEVPTSTASDTSTGNTTDETTGSTVTTADDPDLETIIQVLDEDPLFDQLSVLVDDVGLDSEDLLGGSGPITLLAPTDDAFDEAFDTLGADAFGAMTTDPDVVRSLLRLHIAEGAITSDTFDDGPIEMLDGSTVVIDAEVPTFSSAGATAGVADPDTQLDIRASNGVVHAIDDILLPADFSLPTDNSAPENPAEPTPEAAGTEVEYVDGRVTLSGVVSSDEQRTQLRGAAETNVHPDNVADELTVIDDGPTDVDSMAVAVEAMVADLVSGDVGLVDGELSMVGMLIDEDARPAIDELASAEGFTVELSTRPIADEQSATALQSEMNEFVRANPIEFEPESIDPTPDSIPIVDQLAAQALRLQGTDIVVVGFTDTAGSAESNQFWSEQRATVVRDMFAERSVPDDSLTAAGFGENAPILRPDGTEDVTASRRIEFVVTSR